jgi:hypothetical protein
MAKATADVVSSVTASTHITTARVFSTIVRLTTTQVSAHVATHARRLTTARVVVVALISAWVYVFFVHLNDGATRKTVRNNTVF